MTTSEKNIAAEDVKHKLFETLKTRGVLDSLKSQLRKQLIWELQDSTGLSVLQSSALAKIDKNSEGTPLYQRIANSLVAEHLKRCKYEYTLSTFLPESGTSSDKVFCLKDILHLLQINPESKLYKNLEHSLSSPRNAKGFLWQFMLELTVLQSKGVCNAEVQTDQTLASRTGSLEEKLASVEKEFSEKLRIFQLDKNQGMEEKLIAVQKKYEIQKRKELQDEIKRFKATEISRLRLEESEKYEREVQKIRQEYDHEYNLKSQALRAMEKETLERLQRHQEVHESEAYSERQKFLQEMNSLKGRDADLRNKIGLHERSRKIEEERLVNEVSRLKILEDALREKENVQEERYKAEMERFKRDYHHQFTTRQQNLLHQESSLKVDRSKLESDRTRYLKCQDNLSSCKERNVELESSVETSRLLLENMKKEKKTMEEKLAAMKGYETLKQKEVILKKDIEHLTQQLMETNVHCKEQEIRHQSLLKELTDKAGKPSKQILALRKEVKDVKEKYKSKEKSSSEGRKNLESRLHVEMQRANHFEALYENQLTSQHLMENEIDHLKTIQQQTEQLLSMELRHQKANNIHVSSTSPQKSTLEGAAARQSSDREISMRKFDTDDSSGMDESSMISLAEDKKIFKKLEREAEALDASYRDFQHRVRQPHSQTLVNTPSSMTFHRMPSYHSFHSPQKVHKATWISSTAPPGGLYPLESYEPPDDELEWGKLPSSDENVILTIKDLENNDTSSPERTALNAPSVHGENYQPIVTVGEHNKRPEHHLRNRVPNEEYIDNENETLVEPSGGTCDISRPSDIAVDRKSLNSSQSTESERSTSEEHRASEVLLLHHVTDTTLDNMWERQQHDMGGENVLSHRTSTSLDMEELEKRRLKDDDCRQVDVEDPNMERSDSEKALSADSVRCEDLGSAIKEEVRLSAAHDQSSERGELEMSNETSDQHEATIDPVMLKYMEMIKQRRENEVKQQQDDHSDNLVENDDNDVSIGKLSDEDFNWE